VPSIANILQYEVMQNFSLNLNGRRRELEEMSPQALLARYFECRPRSILKGITL